MCDSEFEDREDDIENLEEETKGDGLRDLGDDIEEEPLTVTIKTLTPSSAQL